MARPIEVKIGSVCNLINGRAFKPSDWKNSGLPIVRIQNLNNSSAGFNYFDGEVRERFLIESGELLFSWSGTPGTSFGAFFWQGGKAVLNQHIFRVLVDPSEVDSNYFRYALNFRLDRIIAQSHGGVGLKHITKGKLEATTVPLPAFNEQRRIAAILDKADAVRRKRKEAIALTEDLLRSAFLEMFGDPVTNPKGWDVVKLEKIIDLVSGQVDPRELPYAHMIHVGGENIESDSGEIRNCKTPAELSLISGKYLFQKGDILYSKIRPYLNKVSLPDFDGVCSADIYPIRVKNNYVDPLYITSILRSAGFLDYAEKHSTRTNIPKINRKALLGFECPLPPLKFQKQFLVSANRILSIKENEKRGSDRADNLFNSLLQRAFRGDL